MELIVRPLEASDFSQGFIESLSHLRFVGLTPEEAGEIFAGLDVGSFYNFYVAELDGRIVGTITLLVEQKFIHRGAKAGHIEDVSVHDEFCGRGIGRMIVDHAIHVARERGCYRITLDCDPDKVAYYEKCGFHSYGRFMRMDLI